MASGGVYSPETKRRPAFSERVPTHVPNGGSTYMQMRDPNSYSLTGPNNIFLIGQNHVFGLLVMEMLWLVSKDANVAIAVQFQLDQGGVGGTQCRRLASRCVAFSLKCSVHRRPAPAMDAGLWLWIWVQLTTGSPFWQVIPSQGQQIIQEIGSTHVEGGVGIFANCPFLPSRRGLASYNWIVLYTFILSWF